MLLRQDKPALGRGFINRRYKYYNIIGLYKVAYKLPRVFRAAHHAAEPLLQLVYAAAGNGAYIKLVFARFRDRFKQVALVVRNYIGYLLCTEQGCKLPVRCAQPKRCINHQHRYVRAVERLPRPLHAHRAEFAFIVQPRRVYYHHGAKRQYLHRLLHGVGGGSLYIGHQRKLLPRYGVHNAGFARISKAEKAYVRPFGGYLVVQSHGKCSFCSTPI